jgi:hypothetical protein
LPAGVSAEVSIVRLERKSEVATPTFGVKIATLSGGTPLATKKTSAVEFPTMCMSNLANPPALIVSEDGWIWNVNEFVLSAETFVITPLVWRIDNAAMKNKSNAVFVRERVVMLIFMTPWIERIVQ